MLDKMPYCFTKEDIIFNFTNKFQFDNWLKTKIRNRQVKRIRNGLYVSLDSMNSINVTKYEIASKISKDSYIAYHSALEYYGIANQVFNIMTVCSSTKFNTFEFEGIEYYCKQEKNYEQVNYIIEGKVRITTLERTIVDCIDNVGIAGGIDEVLNALEQITVLDEKKLLKALKSYNQILLYQKVGYILEQFQNELTLSDSFFEECQKQLTNQVKYFLNDEYSDIEYNSKWKLMAPKDVKIRINGGI